MNTQEAQLRSVLADDPTASMARFRLAALCGKEGRTAEAVHELAETLRQDPRHVPSYLALGALYKLSGRGGHALELYEEGLRHAPGAHALREELRDLHGLAGDLPAALRQAAELVWRRRKPADLLVFGELALAAGEVERAEGAFRIARDMSPESWGPHYNLAELQRVAGFEDEALAEYELAVECVVASERRDWRPYNGLGLALLTRDVRVAEARDLLAQAVELAPARPEPRFNLALANARLADYDAATREARKALELAPEGDTLRTGAEELIAALAIERSGSC